MSREVNREVPHEFKPPNQSNASRKALDDYQDYLSSSRFRSVTAPRLAELASLAYLAKIPRV